MLDFHIEPSELDPYGVARVGLVDQITFKSAACDPCAFVELV